PGDVLRHANAFVCLPHGDTLPHPGPCTPRLAPAMRSTITTTPFQFATALPVIDSATNCRLNPIAHRVRRKHQRLPPSLLIENASERFPLPTPSVVPRRFRSRLATTRELAWVQLRSVLLPIGALPPQSNSPRCPLTPLPLPWFPRNT